MFTLPLGGALSRSVGLDFDTGERNFPMRVKIDTTTTISAEWRFKVSFGFDLSNGFFINTHPEDDESEFGLSGMMSTVAPTLETQLFFLDAAIYDLQVQIGAGIFLDLIGGEDDGGRLGRGTIKNLNKVTDLFDLKGTAGAILYIRESRLGVTSWPFEKIGELIPTFFIGGAFQFRRSIGDGIGLLRRRGLKHGDRLRIGDMTTQVDHPAYPLLRSLQVEHIEGFLEDDFAANWEPCPLGPGYTRCGKITNIRFDVSGIYNLIKRLIAPVSNVVDGFLQTVLKPLIELRKPLKAIGSIAKKVLSCLTSFRIWGPGGGGADAIDRIFDVAERLLAIAEKFKNFGGNLTIADECQVFFGFWCEGGLLGPAFDTFANIRYGDDPFGGIFDGVIGTTYKARRRHARQLRQYERRLQLQEEHELSQVHKMPHPFGQSLLPFEEPPRDFTPAKFVDRELLTCTQTFTAPACVGTCQCIGPANLLCKFKQIRCFAQSELDCRFPLLENPRGLFNFLKERRKRLDDLVRICLTHAFGVIYVRLLTVALCVALSRCETGYAHFHTKAHFVWYEHQPYLRYAPCTHGLRWNFLPHHGSFPNGSGIGFQACC